MSRTFSGVAFLIIALALTGEAFGCSCAPISPDQAMADAEAVFVGTAINQRPRGLGAWISVVADGVRNLVGFPSERRLNRLVTFDVLTNIKNASGPTIDVEIELFPNTDTWCDQSFEIGETYLVYARGETLYAGSACFGGGSMRSPGIRDHVDYLLR